MFRQLNAVLVLMASSSSPFSTAALFVAGSAWQTVSKELGRMKKSILCALLATALACCGTALYAQQDNMSQGAPAAHRMPSPEQRLRHMTKTLNLSDEQQQKIKPLLESESQQMQSLRQDTTMSKQDRMAKMQQIRQGTNDQIKGVLSNDQQQKWQQMQENHMQGGEQGKPKLQ